MRLGKHIRNSSLFLFLIAFGFNVLIAGERADIVVAKDGSGSYTSIQEALDAIPAGN